ncbi:hypothetical protein [Cohnella laeviribosi]|uniref:hypothetical protein n=1 Tax=Cohnella laeviribosi TaxID=380174 RepID=UPI003D1E2B8D
MKKKWSIVKASPMEHRTFDPSLDRRFFFPNGFVADRYNILFELPDYLQNTFKNILKRDLAEFNKTDRWILPVPATYMIDREGIIRFAHVNPDFMKRLEPQEMIDQLKKL